MPPTWEPRLGGDPATPPALRDESPVLTQTWFRVFQTTEKGAVWKSPYLHVHDDAQYKAFLKIAKSSKTMFSQVTN